MTTSISSDTRLETIERTVILKGVRPIMFDRYAGDNNTKLAWHEKIYLIPGTGKLCLPASNLFSFYTATNTSSAPKQLRDSRKYKAITSAIQSFTMITAIDGGDCLPITRNGEQIEVGKFGDSSDPKSGIYLDRRVARLEKGIPNPKERPTLPLDWEITFLLTIFPNKAIKEAEIRNLTIEGGLAVGLGTFRGQFGKFIVDSWE